MDLYIILHLMALILLLLASAFFSGSEIAFFNLHRIDIERIKDAQPDRGARIEGIVSKPRDLIASVLLGNEVVNISVAAVVTSMILHLLPDEAQWRQTLISTAAATVLLLVFGEISPKTVAVHYSRGYTQRAVGPLSWFMRVTTPIRRVFLGVMDLAVSVMKVPKKASALKPLDEQGLKTLVHESRDEGLLLPLEQDLINNVLELDDIALRQIMQPLDAVKCVSAEVTAEALLATLRHAPYSRFPVYQGDNHANISGMLYVKDLLPLLGTDMVRTQRIGDLARPLEREPASQSAERLLRKMRKGRYHIAMVVDEWDRPLGIVTLEDILEEVVGEIHDEKETAQHPTARQAGPQRPPAGGRS